MELNLQFIGKTRVQGNSAVITVPSEITEIMKISKGDILEMVVKRKINKETPGSDVRFPASIISQTLRRGIVFFGGLENAKASS